MLHSAKHKRIIRATNQRLIVSTQSSSPINTLTQAGRYLIVISAFLGWFFAGWHLGINSLAMGSAAKDLLRNTGQYEVVQVDREAAAAQIEKDGGGDAEALAKASADKRLKTDSSSWFGYYVCALLFGGAAGGLVFGRIGDRFGRVKGMTAAICCYSGMSLLAYYVQAPWQLLVMRFLVCMGMGGMWPNGVALMSEVWSGLSRPLLAGVIGTAANIGIFVVASIGKYFREVSIDDWRWVMLLGGAPIVLGILIPFIVPESPRWLAQKTGRSADEKNPSVGTAEIFPVGPVTRDVDWDTACDRAAVRLWGSSNWAAKWAEDAGSDTLKAQVVMWRSLPGIVGSFLGGWVASLVGRRRSYLLNSLVCLASTQSMFGSPARRSRNVSHNDSRAWVF